MTENAPGKRLDEVWLFLSKMSGEEGLVAPYIGGTWLPLVATDKDRLEQMWPFAERIAQESGFPVIVRHYTADSSDGEIR